MILIYHYLTCPTANTQTATLSALSPVPPCEAGVEGDRPWRDIAIYTTTLTRSTKNLRLLVSQNCIKNQYFFKISYWSLKSSIVIRPVWINNKWSHKHTPLWGKGSRVVLPCQWWRGLNLLTPWHHVFLQASRPTHLWNWNKEDIVTTLRQTLLMFSSFPT